MSKVLNRPTLVLNRVWQPINVATVARALVMVCNAHARVVDPANYELYTWEDWTRHLPKHGEDFIQSVRSRVRVPEVIVLCHFDRVPVATVSFNRRNVFKRDGYACQYCGVQPGSDALTIDHVLPRSRGGLSVWDNCVLACVDCNKRKADRTPAEAGMKLKRAPIRPRWKPLFAREHTRIESWTKFVSEAYWNVELAE